MTSLLALDLDGTLIDRSHRDLPQTGRALARIAATGVRICIATGRMSASVRRMLELMDLRPDFVIALNGAEGWSFPLDGAPLWRHSIESAVAREVLEFARARGAEVQGYVGGELRILAKTQRAAAYAQRTMVTAHLADARQITEGPQKLLAIIDPAKVQGLIAEVRQHFGDRVSVFGSEPEFCEIVARGVDKGSGLQALCDRLGIAPSAAAAGGNAENDLPMLRLAGRGFAPQSAAEEVAALAERLLPDPPAFAEALAQVFGA